MTSDSQSLIKILYDASNNRRGRTSWYGGKKGPQRTDVIGIDYEENADGKAIYVLFGPYDGEETERIELSSSAVWAVYRIVQTGDAVSMDVIESEEKGARSGEHRDYFYYQGMRDMLLGLAHNPANKGRPITPHEEKELPKAVMAALSRNY